MNPADFLILNFTSTRTISVKVFHKPNKFPIHWSSQTPKRYKRNALTCELHRAFVISDCFDEEVTNIRNRYLHAGFPGGFVDGVIRDFKFTRLESLIPKNFFETETEQPIVRVRLPFCKSNENLARTFLKKVNSFLGDAYSVFIIWNTCKVRSLFPLKDRNLHPQCVIYEGVCSCGAKYIGETDRCFHIRKNEHEDVRKDSEPAKHLKEFRDHIFEWRIIAHAQTNPSKRRILEALHICKYKPGLNEQVRSRKLKLFPNGLT